MRVGDTLVGRFVIEESAAGGGVGAVWKAWDLETEQPVAIKLLRHLGPEDVKRFRREAAMLAEARVPGVVGHVQHGTTTDGVPYLVMDWLDGITVARRMEDVGFDAAEAVAIVAAVCRPLAALHARGIVHRDIKPENLVMTSERCEDVVVIDLGLARAADETRTRVTATGCVLGTPGYMAPEQVRGAPVDARSDVFALGCVLYECLTGYAAFAGENFFAVRTKILITTPPSVRSLCATAPDALEELVQATIAKSPSDRPRDAGELAGRLAAIGPIVPGERRRWHASQPATGIVRPPATARLDRPIALVVFRTDAAIEDVIEAHGGRVQRDDSGGLAAVFSDDAPARAAIRAALAVRRLAPRTIAVVALGEGALEDLIDRAARLLDQSTRALLVETGGRDGAVVADDDTMRALNGALELVGRRVIGLA